MTPAKRARLIDKQEFEAECRAVRQRVYARLGIKDAEEHALVRRSMAIPVARAESPFQRQRETRRAEPKPTQRTRDANGQLHTVAGRTLTRRQWAEELGITYNNMNQKVHKHGSVTAVVIRRLGASANG